MVTILSMFFRAKRFILLSLAVFAILLTAALLLKGEKYKAHMAFLVRTERAEPLVGSDPKQNSIQLAGVTESDLNSEVELLGSTTVLRQVVLATGLAREFQGPSDAATEKATRKLGKHLTVTPVRNSSLIDVEYDSPNRAQAQSVLTELARVYLAERTNLHAASEAGAFFTEQTSSAESSLKSAEAERSAFLEGRSYGSLPQQMQLTQGYLQDLQRQLDDAQAQLSDTLARFRRVNTAQREAPSRIATQQRIATNPYAFETLTTTLVTLQNRRTELLTKFKPDDRLVQQADQEIANTQAVLSRTENTPAQDNTSDVNPRRQSLDSEADRLMQVEAGLTARTGSLRRELALQQQRLAQMQADSARVEDLERNVKSAADRYDLYQTKAVAAKIADDLDARNISNVVLATRPTVPALPESSPFNPLTAALLAVVLALTAGFSSQLLSQRLHGPAAIEQALHIPVLATLALEESRAAA